MHQIYSLMKPDSSRDFHTHIPEHEFVDQISVPSWRPITPCGFDLTELVDR